MCEYIESTTIPDLQWKRGQAFFTFKMANTPHKGKIRHILFKVQCLFQDENDIAPDEQYYIRRTDTLFVLANLLKNDNSSSF